MLFVQLSLLIVMALSWFALGTRVSIKHSSDCLRSIERLFGMEIQPQEHLYEVNKDYALQLHFDKNCEIPKIRVAPKYFWEQVNPQWKEPSYLVGLSEKEYQDVLAKVEQIRKLGFLISKGTGGTVTNSKLWLLDHYELAFIERGVHFSLSDQDTKSSELVYSFTIYFLHRLEGKIEEKGYGTLPDGSKTWKLKIKRRWYLTTDKEFHKARVGKRASLMAAGPTS